MKTAAILALAVGLSAGAAWAADSDRQRLDRLMPPGGDSLSEKDRALVKRAEKWQDDGGRGGTITIGQDGVLRFLHGHGAGQPVVVCAVLQVCDVEFEPGEEITGMNAGDKVRWSVEPALSGAGSSATEHVIIKPFEAGLETTLAVQTTRRTYHLRLKSDRKDYMARVGFIYPEQQAARWETWRQQRNRERSDNTIPETGEYLGNLDFRYRVSGSAPWVPLRVFNDGRKTIIQMPDTMAQTEAPVLLVLRQDGGLFSDEETTLVNYRLVGDRYIVDAVLDRAVLVAGVGSGQDRVVIERTRK
jgi:type IV secretion system protein TrbG